MVETKGIAPLQADFRRRALGAAAVSGCLALLGLVLARWQTPVLWHSLAGRGLPLMVLALLNGPIALVAVLRERPRIARLAVAGQIVFVLWAWAVGQWPYLVPPDFSVVTSAAPDITLRGLLLTVTAGMVLVLPSLWWLFHVFKGRNPAGNPVGP
jgi:cytochrome bd ubiquinol oxidase subunit II